MSERHRGVEERWEQFEQEHPYIAAFWASLPWRLLPLYFLAAFLVTWLTIMTLWFASQHAPTWNASGFADTAALFVSVISAVPFFYGLSGVAIEWTARRRGEDSE